MITLFVMTVTVYVINFRYAGLHKWLALYNHHHIVLKGLSQLPSINDVIIKESFHESDCSCHKDIESGGCQQRRSTCKVYQVTSWPFFVISLCCSNLWCAGSGFLFTFRSCFRGCVAFYFGGHDERSCFEIIACWPCPSGSFSVPFFKYPHETSLTELIVIASTCFFGPKSFPQQHH